MRVLSLDQALRVSGYAVFEDCPEGWKLVESGTFEVGSTGDMGKRLVGFSDNLDELYRKHRFTHLVFEDIQLQNGNVTTYKSLAYVQAVAIIWCFNRSMPYTLYAPSHWRKLLGGVWGRKREDQKKKAVEVVKERVGFDTKSSDEADAICIGLAWVDKQLEQ
jgi:Holliday junction resolvasome RuvABC endonuclease subunit